MLMICSLQFARCWSRQVKSAEAFCLTQPLALDGSPIAEALDRAESPA
jgi:hypothetical protein